MADRWNRFWFAPEAPLSLGVSRFLYCGAVLWLVGTRDYSAWSDVPEIYRTPHGLFATFGWAVASADVLRPLQVVWKVALLTSCLGLFTRTSLALALPLSAYFLYLPQNFATKIGHGEAVAVFVLLVLLASRSGDAFSLDAWRRGRTTGPGPSGRYRWPLRAVWLITALILASAGSAKLRIGGLDWISSDNMQALLVQHHYYFEGHAPTRLGLYLAQSRVLCFVLALTTVVVELGMPLALLDRRLRDLLVPSALLMLCGFALLLGPVFHLLIATLAFWVPWDEAWTRVTAWTARRSRSAPAPEPGPG